MSEYSLFVEHSLTIFLSVTCIILVYWQSEEERKQAGQMQELVDRLQNKLRAFKRQIEEAEEIAALNLAKYRKTQVGSTVQYSTVQYSIV